MTIESWEFVSLIIAALLAALLLLVGHWFPWPLRLSRIQAYIFGVASIFGGFALWRALNQDWITSAGLLAICLVSGAAVKGAYALDSTIGEWQRTRNKAAKAEAMDDELSQP